MASVAGWERAANRPFGVAHKTPVITLIITLMAFLRPGGMALAVVIPSSKHIPPGPALSSTSGPPSHTTPPPSNPTTAISANRPDVHCLPARNSATNIYYLGFLHNSDLHPKYHVGAITLAVEAVNTEILRASGLRARLGFCWGNTNGGKVRSIQLMTRFREEFGVRGFIGPSHTECLREATVATAWNMPLISYHCQDEIVFDNAAPTFIRTFPPTMKVVKYIMSIMTNYGWNRTVIFYGGKHVPSSLSKFTHQRSMWVETVEALKASGLDVVDTKILPIVYYSLRDHIELQRMFEETKDKTRVYIFLADYAALIDFVRYKHKVLQQDDREEEYTILAVTDEPEAPRLMEEDKIFLTLDERDKQKVDVKHREPFRNVLLLCFTAPANEQKYREFMSEAINKSIEIFNAFNFYGHVYGFTFNKLMPDAAYLYDAVYLYGQTLKEALTTDSVDVSNGTSMTDYMRGKRYTSIQGYSITIDRTGDSMANYSVYSVTKDNGELLHGEYKMTKIAQFEMSTNNSPNFQLREKESKIWINSAPKPIPKCGWDGKACEKDYIVHVLVGIGVVIALLAVAAVFFCRHYRYEQRLASLLWKVDFRDLVFTDADFNDPMMSDKPKHHRSLDSIKLVLNKDLTVQDFTDITSQRRISVRQSLLRSGADENQKDAEAYAAKFAGIRIATNRGSLVAVRFLKRRHVEVTRTMREELHLLKELQHDNVNRFVGACIDTPSICIVTQYCSRGSLKDLLENDDLHLDDMFIASLVFDLIRGMIFLHDSEIGAHGNLKSTNCLVDSRFVLQIADFGIHHLRVCELPPLVDEETYYGRMLWRAPELLRIPVPPPGGTQRADVYSFGIILFEVHGRAGPWGPTLYSSREITEKVKYPPDGAILRPDTSQLKCEEFIVRCMKESWGEIPECRPDFKIIRMKLKPMQRGLKSNIFDNMLAIMEKYAENLEGIVAARTDQLVEEKKKTEALLLRMLPKYVAEQLKRGNPVVPEHFNSVTIYFSDVVGFTAISAESTPLEVVDMLNDLYTCFDSIIGEYDVYKVETIGDAYMVVSGLPIRNGNNHAGEIASMSLHLLRAIGNFKMRHRPGERLSLRIGIHSGSVVTGVVGLKMPRYCLFGDTVNTASRMESNGEPMKIHCSNSCRDLLTKLGGYILKERGYVNMKGKGQMFTYFLAGEDKSHRLRRISVEKRPLSLDANYIYTNINPAQARRLGGSTCSLRSEDSVAAATESLRLLLNGRVHHSASLSCDVSTGSLESQV